MHKLVSMQHSLLLNFLVQVMFRVIAVGPKLHYLLLRRECQYQSLVFSLLMRGGDLTRV